MVQRKGGDNGSGPSAAPWVFGREFNSSKGQPLHLSHFLSSTFMFRINGLQGRVDVYMLVRRLNMRMEVSTHREALRNIRHAGMKQKDGACAMKSNKRRCEPRTKAMKQRPEHI